MTHNNTYFWSIALEKCPESSILWWTGKDQVITFISSPKENEDGYNIVVGTVQGNQTNPCHHDAWPCETGNSIRDI